MDNMRQAPALKFSGIKRTDTQHYHIPQELCDAIFNLFSGKEATQIKLLIVLLGTKEDFKLSYK